MIRRTSTVIVMLALLTACGGGGGKGSSLPPTGSAPQAKKIGTATFTLKIPSSSTMTKLRRRYYQSQATQGVAIDWTSSNPNAPDYAAPITATCPSPAPSAYPPGVTNCVGPTQSADGGTDYTFQLSIPAGTYPNFTVTTFDQAPASGETFTASANMLAQGQLAAPVVITGGSSNTITNLTFYGIPAAVSFVPGPAQSHVVTYGGNLAVIGNAPQTFFAQAVDADGFVIDSTDGTAPSVTVAEAESDSPQEFTVATTATPYEYTLTAKNAIANATIDLTAVPGGTGLLSVVDAVVVTPIQELWTTQAGGTGSMGVFGFPLYSTNSYLPSVFLDTSDPQLCSGACNWYYSAIDPRGDLWVIAQGYGVYEFAAGAGSQGLLAPSSPTVIPLGTSPQSVAIDSNGYIYLVDSYNSTIKIYNTSAPSSTPLATITDSNGIPASIAIAPNGDIYVGDSVGITVFGPYSGGASAPSQVGQITSGVGYPEGLAFDPSGNLWIYDEEDGVVEVTSATTSSVSVKASTTPGTTDGAEQLGVTAQGAGWMGGPGSLNGIYAYFYSGSTLATSTLYNNFGSTTIPSVWSVIVAP